MGFLCHGGHYAWGKSTFTWVGFDYLILIIITVHFNFILEVGEWSHKGKHTGLDSSGRGLHCPCPGPVRPAASSVSTGRNQILLVEEKKNSFNGTLLASSTFWVALRAFSEALPPSACSPPAQLFLFSKLYGLSTLAYDHFYLWWMLNSSSSCPRFRNSSVSLFDFSFSAMKCSLCLLTLFLVAALNFSFFCLQLWTHQSLWTCLRAKKSSEHDLHDRGSWTAPIWKRWTPPWGRLHYNAIILLTISY